MRDPGTRVGQWSHSFYELTGVSVERRMQKHLFVIFIVGATFVFLTSCKSETVGPSFSRPSFDYCAGSTAQCNDLDQVIDQLESSQDEDCQALGIAARGRFESGDYGFEVEDLGGDLGLVQFRPIPVESEAPLAEYTTGVTWLDPSNWNNGELGRTVTHEEVHHAGDPNNINAEDMAYQCFPQ